MQVVRVATELVAAILVVWVCLWAVSSTRTSQDTRAPLEPIMPITFNHAVLVPKTHIAIEHDTGGAGWRSLRCLWNTSDTEWPGVPILAHANANTGVVWVRKQSCNSWVKTYPRKSDMARGSLTNVHRGACDAFYKKDQHCANMMAIQRVVFSIQHLVCFNIPAQSGLFSSFAAVYPEMGWMSKLAVSSSSMGLEFFKNKAVVPDKYMANTGEPRVFQKYVPNPLLYNGAKSDFRCYVLVFLNPLRVYLNIDGDTKVAVHKYDAKSTRRDVHVSNIDPAGVSLRDRRAIRFVYNEKTMPGGEYARMWDNVEAVVARSILAVVPKLNTKNGERAFALFGVDVIVDTDLHAYVMEINDDPGLLPHKQLVTADCKPSSPKDNKTHDPLREMYRNVYRGTLEMTGYQKKTGQFVALGLEEEFEAYKTMGYSRGFRLVFPTFERCEVYDTWLRDNGLATCIDDDTSEYPFQFIEPVAVT